jgi:proline iminopeptidase
VRSTHSLHHDLCLTHYGRDEYLAPIPEQERADIVLAYHAQLNSVDDEIRLRAARAWTKWEMTTSKLIVDTAKVAEADKNDFAKLVCPRAPDTRLSLIPSPQRVCKDRCALSHASSLYNSERAAENHYFVNEGFMRDGQLLEKQEIDKMFVPRARSVPAH